MDKRIAKVLETGDEYLITRIDFRTNTVYCWGEVTKISYYRRSNKVRNTYHAPGVVKFPKDKVEIREIPTITFSFARKLLNQARKNSVKANKTNVLEGVQPGKETLALIYRLLEENHGLRFKRNYPVVKRDFPLTVTDHALENLIENGYFQVKRTHPDQGFILESYVIALTENDARTKGYNFDVLSTEAGKVYYDEKNGFYFRDTGQAD